jgi:hypothetical protein
MDSHIRRTLLVMLLMDLFILAGAGLGLTVTPANWGYRLALGGALLMLVFLLAAPLSPRLRGALNNDLG